MADLSVFADTYREARGKFLDAARAGGASLAHYQHVAQKGPQGEELFLDVAVLGPKDAANVLLVGSGTHGVEGFCGSGAQIHWMRTGGAKHLPPDTTIVLFHAHNPWGFAHKSRCTEDNVDLNRNFVNFDEPWPANPGYAEIHPNISPAEWTDASVAEMFRWLDEFRSRVGEQAFSTAFNGGQYSHHDGTFFGGERAQWANRAILNAVEEHLSKAKQVAIIDLHTGIGPYLEHIYLCFHRAGTPEHERARAWWGERAVNRQGVTHKAVAEYKGILIDALRARLSHVETTAIVVEFGTRERREMQRACIAGRWIQFEGKRDPAKAKRLQEDYVEAFYPSDPKWREAVLEQSRELIDRSVAGIGSR